MTISYVEDITSEFYRLKGYFISKDIPYQIPKKVSGKKVSGWKDIDVLAINDKEVLIIECKAFLGYEKSDKVTQDLLQRFKYAEKAVKNNIQLAKNKRIRKILVVDSSIKKVENELKKKGITVHSLEDIMKEFLDILRKRLKTGRVGKEQHPITRTLIFLLECGFLK